MNNCRYISDKTERKQYKFYAQHMHMHSCFEPGASMEGHMYHAANLGMKYIWFTDHDIRMGRKIAQIDQFDFEQDALFYVDENGRSQGFLEIAENQKDCSIALTDEKCFKGSKSMKITANSQDSSWNGGGVYFWSCHKRHCTSLLAGVQLEIAVLLENPTNSRVIFDISLSQHPPEHACAHLIYVIGSAEKLSPGPNSVIILLEPVKGWHKYVLDLSHDVLLQDALKQGVGGLDNVFDRFQITLESRMGSCTAYFDDFRIQVRHKWEDVRQAQRETAESIGKHYGVTPFVCTEISKAGPHKNCFTTSVPIIPYDTYGYRVSHEDAIGWVKQHGGIFSLNHPFERFKGKALEPQDKEACLDSIAKEFIENKAWGATLMEVGFPLGRSNFSLDMHLRLWDKLTEAGIFLTGYGSSDNHSNQSGWYDGNNFANWLGVPQDEPEPIGETAFTEAMQAGRLYAGNPVALKGKIRFETAEGHPMGSVITADRFARNVTVHFSCDHTQIGWRFRLVVNGSTAMEETVSSEQYTASYAIKPSKKINYARAELYDRNNLCILLTNPIYVLRKDLIKGIAVCNPVEIDRNQLLYAVDKAKETGMNHIQIVGPIHDAVKGNIDGMTMYRKYSMFNGEKDLSYVHHVTRVVKEACVKMAACGIKSYVWHHELELPGNFGKVFPEVLNRCGDIEVTHPRVKDFLINKIQDFFYAYPEVDGIILTLHETKIPLLKLKDQKLGKTERVKYVTKVLFDTCAALGKELIVRPFASLESDYIMMAKAYEEISQELIVMDKWTQFDWSLTMPHNAFYCNIQQNPLLVEGDIFGEFFGKGYLPLMLKEHIAEKYTYCQCFTPRGYVARIDRAGRNFFGDVNEVNLRILNAHLDQKNVEQEINSFFTERYPNAAAEVKSLMEQTEEVLKKILYANGYYFSELSLFPSLNHCKNHYYFEMMRKAGEIVSDEWYIPRGWKCDNTDFLLQEKNVAYTEASALLERLVQLESRIAPEAYHKLWVKFCNLKMVSALWLSLALIIKDYAEYFDTRNPSCEASLERNIVKLLKINQCGTDLLGQQFYPLAIKEYFSPGNNIAAIAEEIRESFYLEKAATERLEKESVLDYIICGGAMEGHKLQKEVNYSDTLVKAGALCRIPGNKRGMEWSSINAHGWFSYELTVRPRQVNTIVILAGSVTEELEMKITIGEGVYMIKEPITGNKEIMISYLASCDCDKVRIRFDKISGCTPCIFSIKVVFSDLQSA